MASAATPYGMRPIGGTGSSSYSGGMVRAYRVTQNNTNAIRAYGWCTMNAGKVDGPGAVAPISLLDNVAPSATQTPLGVVMGVSYTDPTLKYSLNAEYLPAAAVTAGYTNILVFVNTDPNQMYQIQADGIVLQAEIGLNMNMNVPAANSVTGTSTISGSATGATTITYPLRIVDLVNQNSIFGGGLSAPGDAFTDCIVVWNHRTLSMQLQTGV